MSYLFSFSMLVMYVFTRLITLKSLIKRIVSFIGEFCNMTNIKNYFFYKDDI